MLSSSGVSKAGGPAARAYGLGFRGLGLGGL